MSTQSIPHRLVSHLNNLTRAAIARSPLPYTEQTLAVTSILLRHGLISNVTLGGPSDPNPTLFPTLTPAQKRLWVDLKYRNGLPVLRRISVISKPSLRIEVTKDELGRILTGKRAKNVGGVGMGEVLIVRTPRDPKAGRVGRDMYMDGWQAWRSGLGGELLVRAS